MYRRRRYYRRNYAPKKKYSNETSSYFDVEQAAAGSQILERIPLIVNSQYPMQGMRKIKNIKLTLNFGLIQNANQDFTSGPVFWALVYVPEDTQLKKILNKNFISLFIYIYIYIFSIFQW